MPGTVCWTDLGRQPYGPVWDLQRRLAAELRAGAGPDRLLLVEHEPVVTLGRRSVAAHVLLDRATLAERGYAVYEVERGGDVTYHGPGQLVAYPVLDLRRHRKDVRWYAATLMDVAVRTAGAFGVAAWAADGAETGVWVDLPGGGRGKLASLGVRIAGWVTFHGLALNVATELERFEVIVPCGLPGVRMVSLEALCGQPLDPYAVRDAFLDAFAAAFGVDLAEDARLVVSPEGQAAVDR
jgi:lipoate-protein ligase B